MDLYKEYIYQLIKLSLNEPHIILKDDVTTKLKVYIRLLNNIQFEDGIYHTYYGNIKNILQSFTTYWTETMDDTIKKADEVSNFVTMGELLKMLENTMLLHKEKQSNFEKDFMPAKNSLEMEIFDKVQMDYTTLVEGLYNLKEKIKSLDKQDKVDAFAKEHFDICLKRKNDLFCFTHKFISLELSSVISKIHVSLGEIVNRFRNNVRTMQETSEVNISRLLIRLYEKNKEHLMLSREDIRSSAELAEVERSLDILKDKIEDSKHIPINRLQDEYNYWRAKMYEFEKIENTFKKLEIEERNLMEQENIYLELKSTQVLPPKRKCWDEINDKFFKKKEELKQYKLKAAKTLFTFFSVTGLDRLYYYDNIGKYFVDDLGHQCYVYNFGLNVYHVTCDGTFVEKSEDAKYFYDNNGRFIVNEKNEKVYQIAPCSSSYALQYGLFVKCSKDCHSKGASKNCCMEIKDCSDKAILPDVENDDIKGKLDTESANYLWDTFGHVLPDVLHQLAEEMPKNPIHVLAHKLLIYRYSGQNDMKKKQKEAIEFREKVHQDRLNKIEALHDAWKAKQVKPRKPEESDDTEDRFAYNSCMAQQDFARNAENYFN